MKKVVSTKKGLAARHIPILSMQYLGLIELANKNNNNNGIGWYPKGLYFACFKLASEYSTDKRPVAVKEVIITLLREMLIKEYGFECKHPQERIKEDNDEYAHCTYCFRKFEIIRKHEKKRIVNTYQEIEGIYKVIKNFYVTKKESNPNPDPSSSLQPDRRGGE
jgi:hypothetical protein